MTDLTKEMLPQVPQGGETKAGASGEDALGAYFREIRQYPRLPPEEERELAQGEELLAHLGRSGTDGARKRAESLINELEETKEAYHALQGID